MLTSKETVWGDWIIMDGIETYAGPFDTELTANLMALKLRPLKGERVA